MSVTVGVVEVGVVSQPAADAEWYMCACLHCTRAGSAWWWVSVRPRLGAF